MYIEPFGALIYWLNSSISGLALVLWHRKAENLINFVETGHAPLLSEFGALAHVHIAGIIAKVGLHGPLLAIFDFFFLSHLFDGFKFLSLLRNSTHGLARILLF
jgi:hypothetical protein